MPCRSDRHAAADNRLAHGVKLLLECRPGCTPVELDWHGTAEHACLYPGGEPVLGHEVGETVACWSTMPVDLFPVDVDMGDTAILESPDETPLESCPRPRVRSSRD